MMIKLMGAVSNRSAYQISTCGAASRGAVKVIAGVKSAVNITALYLVLETYLLLNTCKRGLTVASRKV